MKRLLAASLIVAGLAVLLVAITARSDSEFSFSNTTRLTGIHTAVAKTPSVVSVTTTPSTIPAMTNVWAAGVLIRTIQNTGTQPVLYCLGGTVAVTNYHGILAAGAANRDGLGSVLDISRWPGAVSVMTEAGGSSLAVAVVQ